MAGKFLLVALSFFAPKDVPLLYEETTGGAVLSRLMSLPESSEKRYEVKQWQTIIAGLNKDMPVWIMCIKQDEKLENSTCLFSKLFGSATNMLKDILTLDKPTVEYYRKKRNWWESLK